jgi:hypothetical protein
MRTLVFLWIVICSISPQFEKTRFHAASNNNQSQLDQQIKIITDNVHRLTPLCAPDTFEGKQDFLYRISDLAFGPTDMLFLLDNVNHAVRVVSISKGKEILRFGKEGAGPGEFRLLNRIRYSAKKGLMAIDPVLRRATFFDLKGKVINTIPLSFLADDLDFLDDSTYVTSNYVLSADHEPILVRNVHNGRILAHFGSILEIQKGLINRIKSSPNSKIDREMMSYSGVTSITSIRDSNRLIYTQRNPYCLISYDLRTQVGHQFNVSLPFASDDNIVYKTTSNSRELGFRRSPRILKFGIVRNMICVPIFSEDVQTNFLDVYDKGGRFQGRFLVPPIAKGLNVLSATFDAKGVMLVLVMDLNQINWIERFEIDLRGI